MIEVMIVAAAFMYLVIKVLSVDPKYKGKRGERRVRRRLEKICRTGEFRLLNDIYIKSCGREAQIDHILIGKSGIFVIETKTYKGMVTGGENDEEWEQTIGRSAQTYYNPVRQNRNHIRVLKYLLDGMCPDFCYHSLVVFPNDTLLSVNTDKALVLDDLRARVESYKYDNLTSEQISDIATVIRNANIDSKKERRKHIRRIRKEFKKNNR